MALLKSTGNKKVNLDFNKEFINTFSDNIENGNIDFINQTLKDLHEADIANLIENLNSDTRAKLIEIESFNIEPEIFIELNESVQSEVLQLLSIDSLIKIIKRLESDNAIKILENLPKKLITHVANRAVNKFNKSQLNLRFVFNITLSVISSSPTPANLNASSSASS